MHPWIDSLLDRFLLAWARALARLDDWLHNPDRYPGALWHESWRDREIRFCRAAFHTGGGMTPAHRAHHRQFLRMFARYGSNCQWRWFPEHLPVLAQATPRQWAVWFMQWERAPGMAAWTGVPSCAFVAQRMRVLLSKTSIPAGPRCLENSAAGLAMCQTLLAKWSRTHRHHPEGLLLPWAWQSVLWSATPPHPHRAQDRLLSPCWDLAHATSSDWVSAWSRWVLPAWRHRPGEAADTVMDHALSLLHDDELAWERYSPSLPNGYRQHQKVSDLLLGAMNWCTLGPALSWETWGSDSRWHVLQTLCRRLEKCGLSSVDLQKWHDCRHRVHALREAHAMAEAIAGCGVGQADRRPRPRL